MACLTSRVRYEHNSSTLGCVMKFSVINGGCGSNEKLPVIYWLSGLTCTDRNFIEKAGAFRAAVENRVLIVCPDTSPRGVDIQGDSDRCDPHSRRLAAGDRLLTAD
eukprot:746332-Hanusia_phi.AAC.9